MNTVSNAEHSTGRERSALQILQYLAPAAVTAAAMIAFAVLPRELGGLPFTAAAVLFTLFNILTRRLPRSPSRPRGWGVVYVVVLGVVMAGSLTLEWFAVRQGDTPWLPWILAGVVFVFIASGAWIIEGRTTDTTPSAA
jgi:drug/metabolite transporter (DMT)-like permease